jgi:hypothetical protein
MSVDGAPRTACMRPMHAACRGGPAEDAQSTLGYIKKVNRPREMHGAPMTGFRECVWVQGVHQTQGEASGL